VFSKSDTETYGEMEILTTGFPDQNSNSLVSPRRRAVVSALDDVVYRWYWSPRCKTGCNVFNADEANCATAG
jgi:hypothetical protein